MKLCSYIFLLLCFNVAYSQTVEISGQVTSKDDVENIHVINKTLQKFTTTNAKGEFSIVVRANDTLVFSSVQHKLLTVKINPETLQTKYLKVNLTEYVNELDEVVVNQYNLSGDLNTDVKNSKEAAKVPMAMQTPAIYEISHEFYGKDYIVNTATQDAGTRFAGLNLGKVAKLIGDKLFKSKRRKNNKSKDLERLKISKYLESKYSNEELIETFRIPPKNIFKFLDYLDALEKPESFQNNDLEFLDFLFKKRDEFLKQLDENN